MTPLERELAAQRIARGTTQGCMRLWNPGGSARLAGIGAVTDGCHEAAQWRCCKLGGAIGAGGATDRLVVKLLEWQQAKPLTGHEDGDGAWLQSAVCNGCSRCAGTNDTSLLNKGMDATAMGMGAAAW